MELLIGLDNSQWLPENDFTAISGAKIHILAGFFKHELHLTLPMFIQKKLRNFNFKGLKLTQKNGKEPSNGFLKLNFEIIPKK